MRAEIGKPFKMRFVNNSNLVIELLGDIDISKLSLAITNSTSYPSPAFTHEGGSKIKILYNPQIPCNTYFEYLFSSHSTETVGRIKTFWNKISPVFKTVLKRAFITIILTALCGVGIYADKKYNGGKVGAWFTPSVWFANQISDNEKKFESIDTRILSNSHRVYKSEDFKEAEAVINENTDDRIKDLKEDIEDARDDENLGEVERLDKELAKYESRRTILADEYWFLGDGLFAFRETVKKGTEPVLVNFETADDFCDMIGAQVISVDEYSQMSGLFVYLSSIFKVEKESTVPEWTRTESDDSDYNVVLMKKSTGFPEHALSIGGKVAGDLEQTKAAFRCSMEASAFVEAD